MHFIHQFKDSFSQFIHAASKQLSRKVCFVQFRTRKISFKSKAARERESFLIHSNESENELISNELETYGISVQFNHALVILLAELSPSKLNFLKIEKFLLSFLFRI